MLILKDHFRPSLPIQNGVNNVAILASHCYDTDRCYTLASPPLSWSLVFFVECQSFLLALVLTSHFYIGSARLCKERANMLQLLAHYLEDSY